MNILITANKSRLQPLSLVDITSTHESGAFSVYVELTDLPRTRGAIVHLVAENTLNASEWYEFGPYGVPDNGDTVRMLTRLSLPSGKIWYLEAEVAGKEVIQRIIRT
jgi:hypothetical protein